jgi:hypothetical protein
MLLRTDLMIEGLQTGGEISGRMTATYRYFFAGVLGLLSSAACSGLIHGARTGYATGSLNFGPYLAIVCLVIILFWTPANLNDSISNLSLGEEEFMLGGTRPSTAKVAHT